MTVKGLTESVGARVASRRRRIGRFLPALFALQLGACYTFVPLQGEVAPAVGERYALHISDQGRVGMAERFGPGLSRVEGRMTQVSPQEFALNVFRVDYFGTQGSTWAGENVRIDRGQVARVDLRRFSRKRTFLAVGAVSAVAAYFVFSRDLLGLYTGDKQDTPGPVPETSIGFTRTIR